MVHCVLFNLLTFGCSGGGVAATALKSEDSTDSGTHIMVAGIVFQVFVMTAFLFTFFWFLWRVYRLIRRYPDRGESQFNPQFAHIRQKWAFRWFPLAIVISVLFIYIRCVYRVAELAEGWSGYLIEHEVYVLVLDGLMVLLGVIPLTIIHPGFALGKEVIAVKGVHIKKVRGSGREKSARSSPESLAGPF